MANYQLLKAAINAVIKANGNKEITGTVLNEVLLAMVNSLGAGYQFAGVATPSTNPGTPDQKVFYIASQAGTYNNFGGAVVSDGIAIFEWNGSWSVEMLTGIVKQSELAMALDNKQDKLESGQNIKTINGSSILGAGNIQIEGGGGSITIDPTPTEDSPNAVSSGGTYDMIVHTAATLFGDIQDATDINATLSADGKIYNDYNAGDIFYIEQDDVRKYRVAYAAGTADAEHPVTINGTLFYYADNASDAIWLSLRIKTVSTEQQSLSAQQKAQARTNIAAVSYDQQSLNAGQQVQAQNNMMGKAYSSVAADHSGLGKVYLDKNNGVLTQSMMQAANTVYVIQYDYTLAANITIPAGCTLEFDGGSITGGAVFSNNTKIANIPSNLYIIGRIYNTNGEMITSKGDVINRKTRLVYAVSTLRKDSQMAWLYDEYGISTQIKGSTLIGITECYVDITLNIAQNGTISFIDYIPDVNYIINYLKAQGIFNSVFAIRFNHRGYTTISPELFMNNLKSFELNVIQQLKSAGLEFENVFFANEREDWVSTTTPANEYIPYLISIADAITELGYTPYIDSTNWYHLSEADTRLISHAAPSYNFYPPISMLDENTIYSPDMINDILLSRPAYGDLTYKDVGICESGVNSRAKALRNPSESDLTVLGDFWKEPKIIFARVIKDFIDKYRIPFYGIWYTEGLNDTVDLEELYNIYLNY